MRALADRLRGQKEESEVSSGMLFSTGLVAGGSIAGLLIVLLAQIQEGEFSDTMRGIGERIQTSLGDTGATIVALIAFAVLCALLVRQALKKMEV